MPARLFILDLDGTVYRGEEPTPHAAETLAELRRRGAKVRFLTNNSGQTRSHYAEKLARMGIEAAEDEVWSSALGATRRLAEDGIRSVYAIGEPGLLATLGAVGIRVVNQAPDGGVQAEASREAQAALVGICRRFSYDLLNGAMQTVRAGGAFYATNTDRTYPLEAGREIPGAGSLVAAVAATVGRDPIVIGKPEPYLVNLILEEAGVAPEETVVVGDRPETDLEAGARAGCRTHLVLCGVVKTAPGGQPHSDDLRGLLELV